MGVFIDSIGDYSKNCGNFHVMSLKTLHRVLLSHGERGSDLLVSSCDVIVCSMYWYLGTHLHRAITLYTLYTLLCMDILMCIIFTSEYTQHKIGHTKKIPKEYSIRQKNTKLWGLLSLPLLALLADCWFGSVAFLVYQCKNLQWNKMVLLVPIIITTRQQCKG